jgi:polysaccharide export outer membrane protein
LREPVVNVQYLNRKITVLGEVQRPQVINLADERISLIDALVVSGDLNEKANRKDIMIIRDSSSVKKVKHINLEDHSVFSSPWYYLQANDIVYVMTDKRNIDKEDRRRSLQTSLSLIASGISLIVIIINALTR